MSICRYCQEPVSWLQRPNGSWYPPFQYDQQLETVEYVVSWENNTWMAKPLDQDLQVKVQPHSCMQRAQAWDEHQTNQMLLKQPEAVRVEYRTLERTVRVQTSHERFITVAKQLRRACAKCDVPAFTWCVKVKDRDVETANLHVER